MPLKIVLPPKTPLDFMKKKLSNFSNACIEEEIVQIENNEMCKRTHRLMFSF